MRACDGRVTAVTGGTSRGIGLAAARALLQEGASVAVCGRSEERGAKTLAEMGAGEPTVITSNAICPGAVETETMQTAGRSAAGAAGITYEEFLDGYAQESMIERLVKAEEVAAMAVLLASESRAGITGSLLNVGGGTVSW